MDPYERFCQQEAELQRRTVNWMLRRDPVNDARRELKEVEAFFADPDVLNNHIVQHCRSLYERGQSLLECLLVLSRELCRQNRALVDQCHRLAQMQPGPVIYLNKEDAEFLNHSPKTTPPSPPSGGSAGGSGTGT